MKLHLNTGIELEVSKVTTNIDPNNGFPRVFIDITEEHVENLKEIFTPKTCSDMAVYRGNEKNTLISPLIPIEICETLEDSSKTVTVILEGVKKENTDIETEDFIEKEVNEAEES